MNILYALQIIGGAVMALAYFPQIRQTLKTKSVRDLNIRTFILLTLGIAMMEAYAIGLVVHDHTGGAFLITNTLGLLLNMFVVTLIAVFRRPAAASGADAEAREPVA